MIVDLKCKVIKSKKVEMLSYAQKKWQVAYIAPLNRLPLLPSGPGGVQQELVVQDLPAQIYRKSTKIPVELAVELSYSH